MKIETFVDSEIGKLEVLLTHSPDGGIGKIIPSKFEDWLYDDTVDLRKMQKEYDQYRKILLYFLDYEKAIELDQWLDQYPDSREALIPGKPAYISSDKVIEVEELLFKLLENKELKTRLISSICSIENSSLALEAKLIEMDPVSLGKTLITGVIKHKEEEEFVFPPIPNLVFTRDIGITIKDSVLLSKTAKTARKRESIIAKYLFYYLIYPNSDQKVIEITDPSDSFLLDKKSRKQLRVTIEGGDIMMIGENHLIIGCSERTSATAIDKLIHSLYSNSNLEIEYISVIRIERDRAQMHIDTIFTQVSKAHWVLHPKFSKRKNGTKNNRKTNYNNLLTPKKKGQKSELLKIIRFYKSRSAAYDPKKNYHDKTGEEFHGIEDLLRFISIHQFKVKPEEFKIVYSANGEYPYSEREQWTDSCNLLAIDEGVVIGYDRNHRTTKAFQELLNYNIISSKDLIKQFKNGYSPSEVKNTLILLPSNELSRARGGSHCMSFPLKRKKVYY